MKNNLLTASKQAAQGLKLLALQNRGYIAAVLMIALVLTPTAAMYAAESAPTLNLDFTGALSTIFGYASMIFIALIPVAAIGIGFRFGGSLLSWVGDMLGDALRMRH